MKPATKGNRRQRGAALVEFAVSIPVFFIMTIGLIDVGRAVWTHTSLGYVSRGAVRFASVRSNESGNPANVAAIEDWIVAQNTGLDPQRMTVTAQWDPANTPGSNVQVDVAYSLRPVSSVLGVANLDLSSSARLTISF